MKVRTNFKGFWNEDFGNCDCLSISFVKVDMKKN